MKRVGALLLWAVLLCGCAAQETFETIADVYVESSLPVREIALVLPAESGAPALAEDGITQRYTCTDYEILTQVRTGGNLDGTIQALTGLNPQQLTVLHTRQQSADRYDFVWCTAGETGEQVARGAVLDDGCCHYCLMTVADEVAAGALEEEWQTLFHSFGLS